MTKNTWPKWGLTVAAALALQACGGGGGGSDAPSTGATPSTDPAPVTAVAHAQGTVYDTLTGERLEGVTIVLGGKTVSTNDQGQFDLEATPGASLTLRASKTGYADGQTQVDLGGNGQGATVVISLAKVGTVQSVTGSVGGNVTLAGTSALVSLPAQGVVNSEGNFIDGAIKVSLTAIDPAAQTRAMPGTYLANDGGSIESFGAIQVRLTDASGKPLQLAPGKTATIRIPLKTRSAEAPAEVPLYYFNESSGRWVQEGKATLNAAGAYYEGIVSHFSTWNADRPITETVFVQGCVRDASNAIPKEPVTILTDGLDYSGAGFAHVAADGTFKVALKRNARARLVAEGVSGSSPDLVLAPSDVDIDQRGACLKLGVAPTTPIIMLQPIALGPVVENQGATLLAGAMGAGQLRYQWRRNGVDMPGQNAPMLVLANVTRAEDEGALFSVVVTNSAGKATSADFRLTVNTADWQTQMDSFFHIVNTVTNALPLALSPSDTVAFSVGQMIPPAEVCTKGSLTSLTLDKKKVDGGEPIAPDVEHVLGITFDHCGETDSLMTGTVLSRFTVSSAGVLSGTSELTALKEEHQEGDNETIGTLGSGKFTVNLNPGARSTALTFANGASVARLSKGLVAQPLVFTGGGTITASENGMVFQDVAFTLGGVGYVLSGSYPTQNQPANQLVLQSGGKVIARTFRDTTQANVFGFKAEGKVPSY